MEISRRHAAQHRQPRPDQLTFAVIFEPIELLRDLKALVDSLTRSISLLSRGCARRALRSTTGKSQSIPPPPDPLTGQGETRRAPKMGAPIGGYGASATGTWVPVRRVVIARVVGDASLHRPGGWQGLTR